MDDRMTMKLFLKLLLKLLQVRGSFAEVGMNRSREAGAEGTRGANKLLGIGYEDGYESIAPLVSISRLLNKPSPASGVRVYIKLRQVSSL